MSFFTQLAQTAGGFEKVTLIVASKNGKLTVAFLPETTNKEVNEKLIPVTLSGTPEEMDAEFFTHITEATQKVSGVVANLEGLDKELQDLEKEKKSKVADKKKPAKKDDKKKAAKSKNEEEEEPETEEEEKEEQEQTELFS